MASNITHNNGDQSHTPIAICGVSIRLPGGIRNADQFWESITNGRDSLSPARLGGNEDNYSPQKDPDSFDASFFAMANEEAESCSPQQRKLLEVTRECLEDACEVNYRGEDACVGCYVGVFGEDDASVVSSKNDLKGPRFVSQITAPWHKYSPICCNSLSNMWYLISMVINLSPTSSLVALHEACCAVRSGDAKSAIVVGSSLVLASKDGVKNGEAVSAVYIKTLPDAIRDGHPIRAIIRASSAGSIAMSHDQGSAAEAYEELIREAYDDAGLDPQSTLLVEVSGKERKIQVFETRTAIG
jgi:acyl transferase domain-containing protein